MAVDELSRLIIPDWYRVERDTGKMIEKLKSLKELDFYLKNPDEFVRRLAIYKLLAFSPKESVFALGEVLDDPLESEHNKYLAAWVMKSLSVKHNYEIFINNRYLTKFSGLERYDDVFGDAQEDEIPAIRFDFSSSSLRACFNLDKEETSRSEDIDFKADFDFKQWIGTIGSKLLVRLTAIPVYIFLKLPKILGKAAFSAIKRLFAKPARKDKNARKELNAGTDLNIGTDLYAGTDFNAGKDIKAKKDHKKKTKTVLPDEQYGISSNNHYDIYRQMYRKPGIGVSIKKGLFNILYVMLFPLRFVLKHKLAILFLLAMLYVLTAFTDYGRAFTNKYMGFDMAEVQTKTVEKLKTFSNYAYGEFNKLTGIDEWKENRTAASQEPTTTPDKANPATVNPANANEKIYLVTSKKGLNIRKAPNPASEKVSGTSLPFGSAVTYLLKTENDPSGNAWYYIKTGDGRTGWVSATFLKEKKEG